MNLLGFRPEYVILNQSYEITINLKDYGEPPFSSQLVHYHAVFDKYISPSSQLEARPELSKKGRLHFHGIIKWKTFKQLFLFLQALPTLLSIAQIEIDTGGDDWQWYVYCRKMRHIIKPMCSVYSSDYCYRSCDKRNDKKQFNTAKMQFIASL